MTWIPESADVLIDIARSRYGKLMDSPHFVYLASPGDEVASNTELRDLLEAGYAEIEPVVHVRCMVENQWYCIQPVLISPAGITLLEDYFGYRRPW